MNAQHVHQMINRHPGVFIHRRKTQITRRNEMHVTLGHCRGYHPYARRVPLRVDWVSTTTTTTVDEGVFVPRALNRPAEVENNGLFAHPNVEGEAGLEDEHEQHPDADAGGAHLFRQHSPVETFATQPHQNSNCPIRRPMMDLPITMPRGGCSRDCLDGDGARVNEEPSNPSLTDQGEALPRGLVKQETEHD